MFPFKPTIKEHAMPIQLSTQLVAKPRQWCIIVYMCVFNYSVRHSSSVYNCVRTYYIVVTILLYMFCFSHGSPPPPSVRHTCICPSTGVQQAPVPAPRRRMKSHENVLGEGHKWFRVTFQLPVQCIACKYTHVQMDLFNSWREDLYWPCRWRLYLGFF